MSPRTKLPADRLYLVFTGSYAFIYSVVVTVSLLYQTQEAGLNPFQLVIAGAGVQVATFLFEIPTGVFADVKGRRLSVVTGITLLSLAFVLLGSTTDFWLILTSQLVLGVGLTFMSGAQEAWIADEIGIEKAAAIYLRSAQVVQIASLAGIPAAVGLGLVDLALPILLGGLMAGILAAFLMGVMPEEGFEARPETDVRIGGRFRQTLSDGSRLVRRTPILITLFGMVAFYETAGEVFMRLSVAHFLEDVGLPEFGNFKSVVWFGVIRMAASLAGLALIQYVRKNTDTANHKLMGDWLLRINILQGASIAVFAVATDFLTAFVVYLAATSLSRMFHPLYLALVNMHIDSSVRATVLSMSSQVDALGQALGSPVFGVVGSVVSIRAALVGSALLMLPTLGLNLRANRQQRESELARGQVSG